MTYFLGNLVTLLGGTVGILIGVLVVGFVIAILALPLLFISLPSQLERPDEDMNHQPIRMGR